MAGVHSDVLDAAREHTGRNAGRKHEDLKAKYGCAQVVPEAMITTLMIKNVPRKHSEDALLHELGLSAAPHSYDFLYLPWDARRSSNVGYAFVNLVTPAAAESFRQNLDGKPWRLVSTPKTIKIAPADVQGLALNLAHYMGSAVTQEGGAHGPVVLRNGQRIGFQSAVELYCPWDLIEKCRAELALTAQTSGTLPVDRVERRRAVEPAVPEEADHRCPGPRARDGAPLLPKTSSASLADTVGRHGAEPAGAEGAGRCARLQAALLAAAPLSSASTATSLSADDAGAAAPLFDPSSQSLLSAGEAAARGLFSRDGPSTSARPCADRHPLRPCSSQRSAELRRLLASESYRSAWAELTEQLEALLPALPYHQLAQ